MRILACLFLLPTLALAQPVPSIPCNAQGISGIYQVDGHTSDGTPLRGEVDICETDGRLQVIWHDKDSGEPGAGVRDGRVVQIAWSYTDVQTEPPSLYLLMPNGDLWRSWNPQGILERLILIP